MSTVDTFIVSDDNPLYFVSDLHFFHKRIIEFTGRPTTLENLNEWIIGQCVATIPTSATTLHLGDMFFSCTNEQAVEVLKKLPGDWWFILGNHDNEGKLRTVVDTVNKECGTKHKVLGWYHKLLVKQEPKVKGEKWLKKQLILCHFPIEDWDSKHYGSAMIHGHVHGGTSSHDGEVLRKIPNRFDVGIDNSHTFTPFSFEDIRKILRKTRERDEQNSC